MKLKQFLREYNDAPVEYDELVSAASEVEDDDKLAEACEAYEAAKTHLDAQFKRIKYRFG